MSPRARDATVAASARPRAAVAVAALLLAAAGAVPAPVPADAKPADARLARLAGEYREVLLAERPDLASRFDDARGDDRLEPVTQVSLARESAWLRAFAARLDSIPRDALSPDAVRQRNALAARVAAQRDELEVTHRWERDPAAYLDLAGDAISALARREGVPACASARAIARRLTRVPEVLRAARINLREPPRSLVEGALPGYEGLLRLYRGELPTLGERCRDARIQADLAQADSTAVQAVEDFLDYLRVDLLPRATGPIEAGPAPGVPPDSSRGNSVRAR